MSHLSVKTWILETLEIIFTVVSLQQLRKIYNCIFTVLATIIGCLVDCNLG